MTKKRRDFLYNLGGLFIGGGLISEKLDASDAFTNAEAESITPELEGTPLGNLSPADSQTHQINKVDDLYEIHVEWNRLDDTIMFYTFEIPSNALENTERMLFRDPIRVFNDSVNRDVVQTMATQFESLFVTDDWKDAADYALKRRVFGENDVNQYDCKREEDHLVCEEATIQTKPAKTDETTKTSTRNPGEDDDIIVSSGDREADQHELETVPEMVRFIQSLQYKKDYKRDGMFLDYSQYPSETVYMGIGDCEDTAILLSTFLENLESEDIRTALAFPPGHCAALAAIPDLPNSEKYEEYTTIDGVPYTFLETTGKTDIYGTPEEFQDVDPLFVYQNNSVKNVSFDTLPATVRKTAQIAKEAVTTIFG